METRRTFEMHIYRGTDLELSPTTTVIFFQVTWIPVYKKAVLSLGSVQRYTLYRDMHSKRPRITRRQGHYGLQGFPGYRAVESESSSDLESSSAKDLSLTHEQIKTDCFCSLPQPCWARGLHTWGFRQPLKYGLIQSPNKLTKTIAQNLPPQDTHILM